jgi:hypothetical protein
MAFDVKQFLDGLFEQRPGDSGREEVVWINTAEFQRRTQGMSAEQVGRLLLEIVDMQKRGVMKNGPAVRVDPPEEASNG